MIISVCAMLAFVVRSFCDGGGIFASFVADAYPSLGDVSLGIRTVDPGGDAVTITAGGAGWQSV
jgi:hypothetical protein